MKIVNVLVGSPKSGTTWLYQQLIQHPQLSLSWKKETNIFLDHKPIKVRDHWTGRENLTDVSPDYFIEKRAAD
jgi:hypothetical protein